MEDLDLYMRQVGDKVEDEIGKIKFSLSNTMPSHLWSSMDYSLSSGGKRLRPILCIAASEAFGGSWKSVVPMALAYEMIHTASLIHDDLPCMDNDDMRRGRPTNHRAYGEALALLAGDALLAWAFQYAIEGLRKNRFPDSLILTAISSLARATGPEGICGGQSMDMGFESEVNKLDPGDRLLKVASHKTGVLISSALESGAILAGAGEEDLARIRNYGMCLGIAFQVADDILDVTGKSEDLGKTAGKDQAQGKTTFVSVHGIEGARRILADLSSNAKEWATNLPCSAAFNLLVEKLMWRTR
ncbi:MAG: polyprenyl synthetase family protein [Thermanaerothrix sp.]|nr:polyprenyl synthetase family protein [Thermanaerothrix sp.]